MRYVLMYVYQQLLSDPPLQFDVTSAFIARASKKQSSTVNAKPRPPSDASPFTSNGTVSSTSLQSNEGAEQSLPLIRDPEVRPDFGTLQ